MIIKDKYKLNKKCEEVTDFKEAEKIAAELINHLAESKNGIGLAANQIGYNKRMFVMDISNEFNSNEIGTNININLPIK